MRTEIGPDTASTLGILPPVAAGWTLPEEKRENDR